MKNLKFISCCLLMLSTTLFISCDKDDSDNGNLVGTWSHVYTKFYEKDKAMGTIFDEEIYYDKDSEYDIFYIFKQGGGFEHYFDGRIDEVGSWSYKGKTLTIKSDDDPDDPFTFEVLKLTGSELILVSNHEAENKDYVEYCEEGFEKVK